MCDVAIPNKEITFVYEKEVLKPHQPKIALCHIYQSGYLSKDARKNLEAPAGRFWR